MRRSLALLLLLAAVPAFARDKKKDADDKPTLPMLVVTARYVFVTTMYGSTWEPESMRNPRISDDDRKAVVDVENELRQWGHYKIAHHERDAELLFVVRAGRNGSIFGGPNISTGPGAGVGGAMGTEMGPARDMLSVHDARQGIDSPALWRQTKPGGLLPPSYSLMKAFEKDVADAAAGAVQQQP